MRNKLLRILLIATVISCSISAIAESHTQKKPVDIRTHIHEMISHHLKDAYVFTVVHDLTFPLPIILVDNGIYIFSSRVFHHGSPTVEKGGQYYTLAHGKIYRTDAMGTILHDQAGFISNTQPLDLSITKNVLLIMLMALAMTIIFIRISKSYGSDKIATGMGRFLEPIIVFVRDEIARPNIGEKHYKKYMGFLLTIFFFIYFFNLVGMTPFGINITGNITITFSLAILTFLITNFTAKKDYWKHIFWMPGVPILMRIVLAPIELLGVIIKPFALMIRLYANMSAGHIVLMSIVGLIFVFKSWLAAGPIIGLALILSVLELLVAAIQAYIFTMLAALYFGMAVESHDDH